MADSSKAPTKRQLRKIVKTQESLLKKDPDNLAARVKMAGALRDLGRIEDALVQYHRVAAAYRDAGRRVQALAVCRSVLEFVPEDSTSLSMMVELEGMPDPESPAGRDVGGDGGFSGPQEPVPSEQGPSGSDLASAGSPAGEPGSPGRSNAQPIRPEIASPESADASPRVSSADAISIVTDFGGTRKRGGQVGGRSRQEPGSRGVGRTSGPGRTIGRIPIVRRPVVVKKRSSRPTIKDIEPPVPEREEVDESVAEEMATPSRPIPESVIRRTLPPDGIEAAARKAIAEESFSEEVPTVERDVVAPQPAGPSGLSGDDGDLMPLPSDAQMAEGGAGLAPESSPGMDSDGPGGEKSSSRQSRSDEEDSRDISGEADSVVVVDDSPVEVEQASDGFFAEGVSAKRPPPLPRDEPLIPDSFGMASDEILEEGPLSSSPPDDRERIDPDQLGGLMGRRRHRHTSPSLLDIREVLQAKREDEIDVLSEEEEAVFAQMSSGRLKTMVDPSQSRDGAERGTQVSAAGGADVSAAVGADIGQAVTQELKLEEVALFRELPEDVMAELRSRVIFRDLAPGDYIVREGDPGHALFVVLSGKTVVEKKKKGSVARLAELGPGSFFGEFALLSDRKRHASVRALGPVHVVEISRKVIGRLAKSHKDVAKVLRNFYRRRLLETLISATPFFTSLGDKERAALVPKLRFKRLSPGDTIVREGSKTGGFYLVLVGRVLVTKQSPQGDVKTLAELGEGEFFGEMSLLKGRPAMATVVAAVPTELVEVAAKDFYRIVGDHPEIWNDVDKEVRRRELANHAILSGRSHSGDPGIV